MYPPNRGPHITKTPQAYLVLGSFLVGVDWGTAAAAPESKIILLRGPR